MIISLLALPVVFAQQNDSDNTPEEVDTVLLDLSEKLGVTLTQNNITSFTWAGESFPDTSLDCPQPDEVYSQVVTQGYQIDIVYQDVTYDYRVSQGGDIVVLCSPPADEVTPIVSTPVLEATEAVTIEAPVNGDPNVAIAPASGIAGTLVQVRAINFPPNTPVVLGVGQVSTQYTVVNELTSNDSGEVAIDFILPEGYEPGTELVIVVETTDFVTAAVSEPFTVIDPNAPTATVPATATALPVTQTPFIVTATPGTTATPEPDVDAPNAAIFPVQGVPGTIVQVIANDFPANTTVVVGLGEVATDYDVVRTARTDSTGSVFTQFTLPPNYVGGEELVVVVETDDLLIDDVSTTFTVLSDPFEGSPQIVLDPATGAPGETLTLNATGFPANTSVIIGFGPLNSVDFSYSLREVTDANGNLVTDITIPADASVIRPYVVLVEVESDRDYQAISNAFTPEGVPPTPLPDGATFESADIYLIAVGAATVGDEDFIGCSDLPVPVTAGFEPTVAPLTSALTTLFSLENRTYGQTGLYNALYQSTLNLDSVVIEDGLATVNLSGSLVLGGVCDTARVDAQIRETALQFSTVDTVNIFLNGQPLADILTAQ